MEEAGEGEANLRARLRFQRIEDCARAHSILGITKHHAGKRVIQRTWRGMCYVMLCLEDKRPDRENIRDYQAEHLGRCGGTTFLCELMPIPKPRTKSWTYRMLFPQFPSADEYYRSVKPRRIKLLRRLVAQQDPMAVVCYGKGYWQSYKELFPGRCFKENGKFLIARERHPIVVLVDHFRAPSMNGMLDAIVKIRKSGVADSAG
jgi:hypothetical protein